jgi:hypothetical protein
LQRPNINPPTSLHHFLGRNSVKPQDNYGMLIQHVGVNLYDDDDDDDDKGLLKQEDPNMNSPCLKNLETRLKNYTEQVNYGTVNAARFNTEKKSPCILPKKYVLYDSKANNDYFLKQFIPFVFLINTHRSLKCARVIIVAHLNNVAQGNIYRRSINWLAFAAKTGTPLLI